MHHYAMYNAEVIRICCFNFNHFHYCIRLRKCTGNTIRIDIQWKNCVSITRIYRPPRHIKSGSVSFILKFTFLVAFSQTHFNKYNFGRYYSIYLKYFSYVKKNYILRKKNNSIILGSLEVKHRLHPIYQRLWKCVRSDGVETNFKIAQHNPFWHQVISLTSRNFPS